MNRNDGRKRSLPLWCNVLRSSLRCLLWVWCHMTQDPIPQPYTTEEKNTKDFSQYNRCPGQDSKNAPPGYKARRFITWTIHLGARPGFFPSAPGNLTRWVPHPRAPSMLQRATLRVQNRKLVRITARDNALCLCLSLSPDYPSRHKKHNKMK